MTPATWYFDFVSPYAYLQSRMLHKFAGKAAIHPEQIPVINRIFTPPPDRVAWAERVLATAEHTGAPGAEVGYIAWGSAQGVVRDAVALCRSFGLNVAALYPKAVLPFPVKELESFARTVKRVVIVESGQTSGFSGRVRSSCSFGTAIIRPEPGRCLTPMDIFLREGLGAC